MDFLTVIIIIITCAIILKKIYADEKKIKYSTYTENDVIENTQNIYEDIHMMDNTSFEYNEIEEKQKWQEFHEDTILHNSDSKNSLNQLQILNTTLTHTNKLLQTINQNLLKNQAILKEQDKKIENVRYNVKIIKIVVLIPFLITIFLIFIRAFAGYSALRWLFEFFQTF